MPGEAGVGLLDAWASSPGIVYTAAMPRHRRCDRPNAHLSPSSTPLTARRLGFWNDNRHTFASRLVMAGLDLRAVQQLGGWKTLSMSGSTLILRLSDSRRLSSASSAT